MKKTYLILFSILNLTLAINNSFSKCEGPLQNLRSPLCTEAKYVLLSGSIITAGVFMTGLSKEIRNAAQNTNSLDSYGQFGDKLGFGFLNGGYFLWYFSKGLIYRDLEAMKNAEIMFEASFYSTITTHFLKFTVREERPSSQNKQSFPSGHTSLAFAFASIVSLKHPWYAGLAAYSAASFIGLSRIAVDAHYLHDVLAGATIGLAYGLGVYLNTRDDDSSYFYQILPNPKMDGVTFMFSKRF